MRRQKSCARVKTFYFSLFNPSRQVDRNQPAHQSANKPVSQQPGQSASQSAGRRAKDSINRAEVQSEELSPLTVVKDVPSDSMNSSRNEHVLLCCFTRHYGYPPASAGSLLNPLPRGKGSKAISHYNMLLVLSWRSTRYRHKGPIWLRKPILTEIQFSDSLTHPAKSNRISLRSQIHQLTPHSNAVMS